MLCDNVFMYWQFGTYVGPESGGGRNNPPEPPKIIFGI